MTNMIMSRLKLLKKSRPLWPELAFFKFNCINALQKNNVGVRMCTKCKPQFVKQSSKCDLNCSYIWNLPMQTCGLHYDAKPAESIGHDSLDPGDQGKFFIENEAIFHHKVIEESSEYAETVLKFQTDFEDRYKLAENEYNEILKMDANKWVNMSPTDVASNFISVSVYSPKLNLSINEEMFNDLISAFTDRCPRFSDEQLVDCLIALKYWPQPKHVKEEYFLRVWKCLDNVCFERSRDWGTDKTLFVMDLWYRLKLTRLSFFVYKGLNRLHKKCGSFTKAQLVQSLFYMSCVRKLSKGISLREYEFFLEKHITNCTVEELGIIAIGFFKTKTRINNTKLLLYMMQRVIIELETIPLITLTAIAKILRYSQKPEIGLTTDDFVNKLLDKKADSLQLVNLIHIVHITTQLQFFNEDAITKLAEKFYSDPSAARLKDIERVVMVLSLYNFIPPSTPDILQVILQELNKEEHVNAGQNHPQTMLSLIYKLSILQMFPEQQIREILNEDTLIERFEAKFLIPLQILQLDYNKVLEGPQGSDHMLSEQLREYLARRHSRIVPEKKLEQTLGTLTHLEDMMLEVQNLTRELLGDKNYLVAGPLPHYPIKDIIFHLDDSGRPTVIPEEMRTHRPHQVLRAPHPTGWHCVVMGGRNMYMHNVPKLIGEQITKLRQLRILGYTPVVLPNHYWRGEKDKAGYLKLKYFSQTTK